MTYQREFATVSDDREAENLGAMLCQCFNFPLQGWEMYRDRIGVENFRVLRQDGQIVGGLAIYHMGQWWGSDRVPMAGIAGVGVSPESRGTGVAVELLTHTLKELHTHHVPLSTLYPATQRVYRKVGYEQAGFLCHWELDIHSIGMNERSLPISRVELTDLERFYEVYRQHAIDCNGNLDRNSAIWEGIVKPGPEDVFYAYLIGDSSQPEGYIIFKQTGEAQENRLSIVDWVALTPAAARRLLTFIADHRSQIQKAILRGSPVDPLFLLLPEQTVKIQSLDRWLLRVIDMGLALENRGYPAGIEAELHLEIRDNLLPQNNGKYILHVSGDRGKVTLGGRGDLRLDVGALAPLYSGLFTPHQLQRSDYIDGTEEAIAIATQIFAGSTPWMADFF